MLKAKQEKYGQREEKLFVPRGASFRLREKNDQRNEKGGEAEKGDAHWVRLLGITTNKRHLKEDSLQVFFLNVRHERKVLAWGKHRKKSAKRRLVQKYSQVRRKQRGGPDGSGRYCTWDG